MPVSNLEAEHASCAISHAMTVLAQQIIIAQLVMRMLKLLVENASAKLTSTQKLNLHSHSAVNHTNVIPLARHAMVHTEINVSLALINTGHTKVMVHANRFNVMLTVSTAMVKVNLHALSANQVLNFTMLVERINVNAK